MSDLRELLERVRAASGPDRELDCRIDSAMSGRDVFEENGMLVSRNQKPPHDKYVLGWLDPGVSSRNFSAAFSKPDTPAFTASIDAALALVERCLPGWYLYRLDTWAESNERVAGYGASLRKLGPESETGYITVKAGWFDNTPALAIVAALLTALIVQKHEAA